MNKVQLIGNLTRDPELRYTPTGAAVCTIGLATSRSWTTDTGEKKEDTQFHRLIAWNKLAELCSQLLAKGRKIYIEGRIVYRKYTNKDNIEQNITEIVISDMLILDNKRVEGTDEFHPKDDQPLAENVAENKSKEETPEHPTDEVGAEATMSADEVADDIPF